MTFRTRNSYYLRISEKAVLPVYVYLDERHLDWMSDIILQHVLSDLRPNILRKLKAEADIHFGGGSSSGKKSIVETHRGETYQFCYFIRSTEPHSVVLKTRSYKAAPPQQKLPRPMRQMSRSKAKRKGEALSNHIAPDINARKRLKTMSTGRSSIPVDHDESEELSASEEHPEQSSSIARTRRSARKKRTVQYNGDNDNDTDMNQEMVVDERNTQSVSESPGDLDDSTRQDLPLTTNCKTVFDLDVEEEEKPKPILQLKYCGFSIYGQCLCVVVEPWPAIRSSSRAPSVVAPGPVQEKSRLTMPPPSTPSRNRETTPLFLPDDMESEIPRAPFFNAQDVSLYTMVDGGDSDGDGDGDIGGMLAFSQALNKAGDSRAGAADDEEEMDGAVLFGDADEVREL